MVVAAAVAPGGGWGEQQGGSGGRGLPIFTCPTASAPGSKHGSITSCAISGTEWENGKPLAAIAYLPPDPNAVIILGLF